MNQPTSLPSFSWEGKVARAVAGALLCSIVVIIAHAQPAVAATTCSDSLQAKIDAAPAGSTVTAEPCIYREQVKISKPLTLEGQPGSEIRGSDVWSGWVPIKNGRYRSFQTLPTFYQEDVSCEVNTERCAWPEQVFVDGSPLEQTNTAPRPGQFRVNPARRVVLGSSPVGKTVEVTVRKHWITGTSSADDVTVRGFTMKHAANDWRCGAIQSREPSQGSGSTFSSCRLKADGDGWKIENNTLLHAAGAVVSVRSKNAEIVNNEIAYGGQIGFHNPGDFSTVSDNRIHDNNTEHFCYVAGECVGYSTDGNTTASDTLVEVGGIKVAGGRGPLTFTANEVYGNLGHGVWFDVAAHDATVSGNDIHHNARQGIFFEISDYASIHDNLIYENGWGTPENLDGAAIGIGNSDNVEVFSNTLAWNSDGIAVRCFDRGDVEMNTCQNITIHDNAILQEETLFVSRDWAPGLGLAWVGRGGASSLYASSSNQGYGNDYYYGREEGDHVRFAWNSRYSSLSSFNDTPGDEGGIYRKRTWALNLPVPDAPEPR